MTNENTTIWRKGNKVILRPLEKNDAGLLYRWINDPATNQYLATTEPKGLGFEEAWIEKNQKPDHNNIVVGICTLGGQLIGTMGLHHINYINRTAITGALIGEKEYLGNGFGTDAKMLLLDYAFNELDLFKVQSSVIEFNSRSAAYSKKCGYVEEGRLRGQFFRAGKRHDDIMLAVFKDQWLPLWEQYQKDFPAA